MSFGPHLYDELASAGVMYRDAEAVALYESKSTAYDPRPDVELLRGHGLGRDSVLLDMGAGSGRFALAAARHCRNVIAVDVSPAMVAAFAARRKGLKARRVRYVQAGVLSYEHPGPPADFIYSRNMLQNLPDFWKVVALRRLFDMLRPGGVLYLKALVFDFAPEDVADGVNRWIALSSSDGGPGFGADDLLPRIHTMTFSWVMEPMLERTGFQVERARYGADVFAEYICVKPDAAG
jgi:ubiquinone/menaquinone biosynthesis C-methylase UbiE